MYYCIAKNKKEMDKFRLLLLVSFSLALTACQFNIKPDAGKISESIVYFKDSRTNICFASVGNLDIANNGVSSDFTCVPCDSLKRVEVSVY